MNPSDIAEPRTDRRSRSKQASTAPSPRTNILSLADQKPRCQNTIDILRGMLEAAEAGELFGMAVVATLRSRKYVMHVSGDCHRNLTFTRGMLKVLDDELADRIRGRR